MFPAQNATESLKASVGGSSICDTLEEKPVEKLWIQEKFQVLSQ